MSDEIKKIDEISETQNAPEIKKEKKKLSKKAKKIIIIVVSVIVFLLVAAVVAGVCALNSYCKTKDYTVVATADDVTLVAHRGMRSVAPENTTASFNEAGMVIGAPNVTFTELRTAFGLSLTTGTPTE